MLVIKLEGTHPEFYVFWCPGCKFAHKFSIPPWTWNGNFDKPTVKGSVLNSREYGDERQKQRCHLLIVDGNIQYLEDCTHEFKGKTPMRHLPGSTENWK